MVDGAFFNSGQCCCGVERIYVHEFRYEAFVKGFVELTAQYVLGDPLDQATTLGPMARAGLAEVVRAQTQEAIDKGAKAHIDPRFFAHDQPGAAYLAPQILTNVDHSMTVMREESFGPVIGIAKVRDDEETIALMNDSPYGLTASVWTEDVDAAKRIGEAIETGTVYMNRCDYLDPGLAWTGVKETGYGASLSALGYGPLTRPKSYHLRPVHEWLTFSRDASNPKGDPKRRCPSKPTGTIRPRSVSARAGSRNCLTRSRLRASPSPSSSPIPASGTCRC